MIFHADSLPKRIMKPNLLTDLKSERVKRNADSDFMLEDSFFVVCSVVEACVKVKGTNDYLHPQCAFHPSKCKTVLKQLHSGHDNLRKDLHVIIINHIYMKTINRTVFYMTVCFLLFNLNFKMIVATNNQRYFFSIVVI